MDRIDKVISLSAGYTRKDVKELVRKKRVRLNGNIVNKSDIKVDIDKDVIQIDNRQIEVKKYVYLVLNKPKGYVSATEDKTDSTVLDLVPEEYRHRDIFPAGRLDKDTTGLMIITDDGLFAHNVLSPKKHIKKTYNVTIDIPVTDDMIKGFKEGVELSDGKSKPALLEKTGMYTSKVILTEGRYHQIKRMFGCYGAKVIKLERIAMGGLFLPNDLDIGSCRELTNDEFSKIIEK